MSDYNVVVQLVVSRPENEFLPHLLGKLLNRWNPYAGNMRVQGVRVLSGAAPFNSPEHLAEALQRLEQGEL